QKAYQFIEKEIQPQVIVRLGATFPEEEVGRGKNKSKRRDYLNLLYDLNAFEAFNQDLVKGIAKEHFEPISQKQDKVKIVNIVSKSKVKFTLIQKDQSNKSFELERGDSIGIISPEL